MGLTGWHCSGKSTVGRLLASALQYPFLDSDKIAEQHADARIAEIFERDGEEAFRDLESAVLQVSELLCCNHGNAWSQHCRSCRQG